MLGGGEGRTWSIGWSSTLLELVAPEEHGVLRALTGRRRHQRDDVVHVEVLERVQRELERLARSSRKRWPTACRG